MMLTNNILNVKGTFDKGDHPGGVGFPAFLQGMSVSVAYLHKLKKDLEDMIRFWSGNKVLKKALVSVYYDRIIAKSNRIKALFSHKIPANDTIVGAKYNEDVTKHIITHYISIEALVAAVKKIGIATRILEDFFGGMGNQQNFTADNCVKIDFKTREMSKSAFMDIVVKASFIEGFGVENWKYDSEENTLITLYKTEKSNMKVLEKIGIDIYFERVLNDSTVLLDSNQLRILIQKAPYLIAMATTDLSKLEPGDFTNVDSNGIASIPSPNTEPIIGVIDTLYDNRVYFNEWVQYECLLDENIPIEQNDYRHGTAVVSLIVDGPSLNPNLDDGCGRFRVRHFGVAKAGGFSSFTIIKMIEEIVAKNTDIRVWNLSLGSKKEKHRDFISPEAAALDLIQHKYGIIFIISGTNGESNIRSKIGPPADSINAIVVNSVGYNKKPADYTRTGPVLSFFTKPDVSYYGGTTDAPIRVCDSLGEAYVTGTSYAAPWIARKMAYLMEVIGLNRELAKALLVDSAKGWEGNLEYEKSVSIGHGVVPIRIEEILKTPKNEIKFLLSGMSGNYDTYTYNLPIPTHDGKYPFIAKATICYFPDCTRNQGVDYTNTELDIYLGPVEHGKNNRVSFRGNINGNHQSADDGKNFGMREEKARKNFRKWDNIKHIHDKQVASPRPRKVYGSKMWGLSIKSKERLNSRKGYQMPFGVVVTLKELSNVNRINDFIQQFSLRGWIVQKLDVENRVDVYHTARENIKFE